MANGIKSLLFDGVRCSATQPNVKDTSTAQAVNQTEGTKMKTFVNPRNGDIATAESTTPKNHTVDIKDEFGNHKERIHYPNSTTIYVANRRVC